MAKIMLVEDDNSLREIYQARLAAEGYDLVSAKDGEEALAMAIKERPDLIIADIMMPKVSGLDMLDILRTTPETKHTKIIMMTALSQAEDQARAEKLGADKYLIKSQVTLEDVVRVAGETLGDSQQADSAAIASTGAVVSAPLPTVDPTPPVVTTNSDVPVSAPPAADEPVATPPQPEPPTTPPAVTPSGEPTETPSVAPTTITVSTPPTDAPNIATTTDQSNSSNDSTPVSPAPTSTSIPVTIASDDTATPPTTEQPQPAAANNIVDNLSSTTAQEEAQVNEQIEDFIAKNPTLSTSAGPTEPITAEPSVETPATPAADETPQTVTTPLPQPGGDTSTSLPKPAETAADTTMANAVDSLAPPVNPMLSPTDQAAADSGTPVSGSPNKKGGERVIQPLPTSNETRPTGQDLIALAAAEEAASMNTPIHSTETTTTDQPTATEPSQPAGTTVDPNNISL